VRKSCLLFSACAFTLLGLSSASAVLPTPAYVDGVSGNNANAGAGCPETAPCADLNTALSTQSSGGTAIIVILRGGVFGPVYLTSNVVIIGPSPGDHANIVSDSSAQTGCVGQLPASCAAPNNGYAVEFAGGANGYLNMSHVALRGNGSAGGALKFTSGSQMTLVDDIFYGGGTVPTVQLSPNTGSSFVSVYLSYSQISGGSNANAGAVLVQPIGNTNFDLHFNHVQLYGASYGIRTDGSLLSGPSFTVSTTISECEFFGFSNAAMNAFSTSGTGTVLATYDSNRILSSGTALKANGLQSTVLLTNNTVTGNGIGILQQNSANILTSGNNSIRNNGTDISGTITAAALR